MNPDQLASLEAIADTGTFEAAGVRLGVSTSAVSQRVRALETSLGRVLIRRGAPSSLTEAGQVVLRYARQQHLLAAELAAELSLADAEQDGLAAEPDVELTTAVNADTLSTWFTGVLRRAAPWGTRLRLVVANESRTAELLRSGQAMSAVSSSSTRVAGCRAEALGALTYEPVAARFLIERCDDPADLPVVRFDSDDDLQDLALTTAGLEPRRPRAVVPTGSGFTAALEAGLGWGMLTTIELAAHPELVRVPGLEPLQRHLYWHRWAIGSPLLDRLTAAVRDAAAQSLTVD